MIPLEAHIVLALLLDALVGDPPGFPHPVRWIGRLSEWLQPRLRLRIGSDRLAGVGLVLVVLSISGAGVALVLAASTAVHPLLGDAASIIILYTTFAAKDLRQHSLRVFKALEAGNLLQARQEVGMLVSRDTWGMSREEVVRAGVESVAENTVDGLTAPLFFAVLGGPVGAMLYKAASTLDSMYGYRNDSFLHFGWCSARLDDLLAWVPARLTALLVMPAAALSGLWPAEAWRIFRRDRSKHDSPNAGQVEAAVAGALGVQFGGRGSYFGQQVVKPVLGESRCSFRPEHILQVNRLAAIVLILCAAVLLPLRMLLMALF